MDDEQSPPVRAGGLLLVETDTLGGGVSVVAGLALIL
jgi:hypothetical protein